MYAADPPPRPESTWPPQSPGTTRIPPIPSYLPEPVPPSAVTAEQEQVFRRWLRIPLTRPVLTLIILAILVIIFIPMQLSQSINDQVTNWGASEHNLVTSGDWYRLITATFLHANLVHILFNGYALYLIGTELEALVGRGRFAAIYAISGLAGSVASYAFSPANVASVGASGAIFGLIGALGVYFGLNRRIFGKLGNAQFWNIVVVIALNLGIGFSGLFPIDNSAHLGGLIAGAALGYVLSPRYALGSWYNPLVRNVVNVNKGWLPWIATILIGLIVIFLFFTLWLLFSRGILVPAVMR